MYHIHQHSRLNHIVNSVFYVCNHIITPQYNITVHSVCLNLMFFFFFFFFFYKFFKNHYGGKLSSDLKSDQNWAFLAKSDRNNGRKCTKLWQNLFRAISQLLIFGIEHWISQLLLGVETCGLHIRNLCEEYYKSSVRSKALSSLLHGQIDTRSWRKFMDVHMCRFVWCTGSMITKLWEQM